MRQDDIERALAEQFDVGHLSVYADFLQEQGDPRGELIALDLRRVRQTDDDYQQALEQWLGRHYFALRDSMAFRYGFVAELRLAESHALDRLALLFASPAAPYVLRARIEGTTSWLRSIVARFVEHKHPWLQRLSLSVQESPERHDPRPNLINNALAQALVDATPSLDALELDGHALFDAFGHPHLRALKIFNPDAIHSLLVAPHRDDAAGFPVLRYLDVSLSPRNELGHVDLAQPGALSPARLPQLTRLTLSNCGTFSATNPVALLATSPISRQLTHISAAQLRFTHERELEQLVASLSALVELEIIDLDHPFARRLPPRVRALNWNDGNLSREIDLRGFMR